MATAEQQAQYFEEEMNSNNIRFDRISDFERPFFKINFGGGDFSYNHLCINVVFDSDGKSVQFATGTVVSVPADKMAPMLLSVNKSNNNFRWVKFYIDSDNDVVCGSDAILAENGGSQCVEMVLRIASIVDDAYPDFMRTIWS